MCGGAGCALIRQKTEPAQVAEMSKEHPIRMYLWGTLVFILQF